MIIQTPRYRNYYFFLRRLKVGERVKIGDWCCDPRVNPVEVLYEDDRSVISKNHHPHYRIQIKCTKTFENNRYNIPS